MLDSKRKRVTLEDEYPNMQPSIEKLLYQLPISGTEYHDLFPVIYSVIVWVENGPKKLLAAVTKDVEKRVSDSWTKLMVIKDENTLLKVHTVEWNKYYEQFKYIDYAFGNLNKELAKQPDNAINVRKVLIDTWHENVMKKIHSRLVTSALKMLEAERNCESFSPELIVGLRDSLLVYKPEGCNDNSATYRQYFDDEYIATTETFYHRKGSEYLQQNGIRMLMKFAQQKIMEETDRGRRYLVLQSESLPKLLDCCDRAMIEPYQEMIIAECPELLRQNDTENLSVAFWCIDRVPDRITPMLNALEQHIINTGLADMVDEAANIISDSNKYVQKLLDMFKRFSTSVERAFDNDPRFVSARDKAVKKVVNDTTIFKLELPTKVKIQPESRSPELLANYCDLLLRKTQISKKLTSDEIETRLKEVIFVLKYVQNKDVFMQYYISHLTRRLILQTSNDNEKEENMIRWLRDIGMPADFVNKVTQMIKDIKISEDFNETFKQNRQSLIDVNVKILNGGAWKLSEKSEIILPVELEKVISYEEDLYKQRYSGKKLQWHHNMSNATILFQTNVGKYDLEVTNLQLTLLFAWDQDSNAEISFESLRMTTLLPDAELKKTIWSFVASPHLKEQVLISQPEAKSSNDFQDETKFTINKQFAVYRNNKPQKRGKINLIGRLQLSSDKSNQEDNVAIVTLRNLRTQEAIVRILKTKRTIRVTQLLMEVVEILKNMFLPTTAVIKQQIDWLIDHEYIRRDENDINLLIYIA